MLQGTHCAPKLETVKKQRGKTEVVVFTPSRKTWGLSSTCAIMINTAAGKSIARRQVLSSLFASFAAQEKSCNRFNQNWVLGTNLMYSGCTVDEGESTVMVLWRGSVKKVSQRKSC